MRTELHRQAARERFGLKGPSAPQWLEAHGLPVPGAPNTWASAGGDAAGQGVLVARLGSSEFFLEDVEGGGTLRGIDPRLTYPPGVYPVLRQDAAFLLTGDDALDTLAQVCNVNFGDLSLDSRPVIMTLMVGVSVLVIPRRLDGRLQFRIWCDPTLGGYLAESFEAVMTDDGKST